MLLVEEKLAKDSISIVGRERHKTNNPRAHPRAVKCVPFLSLSNFLSDFISSQWPKLRVLVLMIALLIQ